MPRSLMLSLTCAIALSVGACDRETTEATQPQETAVAKESSELAGTIDRSFVGTAMPAAKLTDPDGNTLSLGDAPGKPTLVNLWATWCAPCIKEMPLLDTLAGELGDSVRVLTVSEDFKGGDAVKPFFAERGFAHLPMWLDPQNELAVAFGGGTALPLTVLYDAQGKEVWRVMGAYDWSSEAARAAVREALAKAA